MLLLQNPDKRLLMRQVDTQLCHQNRKIKPPSPIYHILLDGLYIYQRLADWRSIQDTALAPQCVNAAIKLQRSVWSNMGFIAFAIVADSLDSI